MIHSVRPGGWAICMKTDRPIQIAEAVVNNEIFIQRLVQAGYGKEYITETARMPITFERE